MGTRNILRLLVATEARMTAQCRGNSLGPWNPADPFEPQLCYGLT